MCTAFIPSWNPGPSWSISPCDPVTVQPVCALELAFIVPDPDWISWLHVLYKYTVSFKSYMSHFPIALKCLVHCRKTWFGFSYRLFPSAVNHTGSLALSDSLITKAEKENLTQTNFDYSHPSVIATWTRDKTEQRHRSDWCVLHSCLWPLCPLSALHECLPLFLMLQ